MDAYRLLSKLVPEQDGAPNLTLRKMIVAAVNSDGTLDLTTGGVTVEDVDRLSSVGVEVGDQVQVLTGRGVSLVIGATGVVAARSWTPALTASTTNPTLGTASSTSGTYWKRNGRLDGIGRIVFGTSGVNPGSGDYRISLPVAASSAYTASTAYSAGHPIGTALLRNGASPGTSLSAIVQLATSTTAMVILPGGGAMGSAGPWAWTATSQIHIALDYATAT